MSVVARLPDLVAALEAHRAGRHAEAARAYEAAIALDPQNADALNLLASLRRTQGQLDAALDLARRAAAASPHRADIHYNLGNALAAAGDHAGAAESFRQALSLDPFHADAGANLGIALAAQDDLEGAAAAYEAALAVNPDHPIAALNRGNVLGELGRFEAAADQLRECAERHPDLPEAHYNLAHALLRLGDFAGGFEAYEWRWRTPGFVSPLRHTRLPAWDGRPFRGRSLLVHAEQGLGDTIQFVRFLPMVATLGGKVTLEVPGALLRLLRGFPGVTRLVGAEGAAGRHDFQVPLMSVPHRLGLTLGAVPAATPYLSAEPDLIERWRERLRPDGRPIVAVCWQGNRASPVDRGRSLDSPSDLAPIASLAGVRLVSLCRLPAGEIKPAPVPSGWAVAGTPFVIEYPGPDYDSGPDGFVDAAAILTLADQVVTTDTALAHLAGALGRPGLLLLKAVPDWRWMAARRDTPWYPTLRLVRQAHAGDFGPVIREARRRLAARLALRGAKSDD